MLRESVGPAGLDAEIVVPAVYTGLGGVRSVDWAIVKGAGSSLSVLVLVSSVCVEEVAWLVGLQALGNGSITVGLGLSLSEDTADRWVVWASEEVRGQEQTLLRDGDGGAANVGSAVERWDWDTWDAEWGLVVAVGAGNHDVEVLAVLADLGKKGQ